MDTLLYRCQPVGCKKHPEWSYNAVVYEVNTRQFSPEGNFRGVWEQLPRLKELGVDIIWMMPVYPIGRERRKGELGSYYSVQDYCAVNPEFGTPDELRNLTERVHELGMHIILDWIPNHTSRDAVWTRTHPQCYKYTEPGGEIATPFDWTDTAQLDYDCPDTRTAMTDAMKYWLREFGIDGFRVDMAMLVPMDFWEAAVPELQAAVPDRTLFMLAEAEGPEFHPVGFDATYSWEVHHLMVDIAQGRATARDLCAQLARESNRYPHDAFRLRFTSNHDENTWHDSEFVRFGAATAAMAALTYILPGMPLIYNGQEAASRKRLEFFTKDQIEWTNLGGEITELYRALNTLKHTHPALQAGERGGDLHAIGNSLPDKVFSVKRKSGERTVIGLFNFSGDHADLEFYDDDFSGQYSQLGSPEPALLRPASHFYLPPWGFFIYYR